MMNLDGSNQEVVTDLPTRCVRLNYCESNNNFYFYVHKVYRQIASLNIENNEFVYLTNPDNYNDANPSINEDGEKILFQSDREGVYQIYSLDLITKTEDKIIIDNDNLKKSIPKWSNNKNGFYYRKCNENDEYLLIYYDFDTKERKVIVKPNFPFNYSFSDDENYVALTIYKSDYEANLYIYDIENDILEQKTFVDFRLSNLKWVDTNQ